MEPITIILSLIAGMAGAALVSKSDSPAAVADKHSDKLYKVSVGGEFAATAFALRVEDGVKLVSAGHVCDSLMSLKIPKHIEKAATSDDKSLKLKLDAKDFKLSSGSDLCVMASLPEDTPAFKLSKSKQKLEDVWSIGYPAGMPLSVVKGHITGQEKMDMPSSRAKELCVGEAYSWKKYTTMTFLGPQEFESCIFKANALTSTLTVAPGNSGSPTINSMGEVVGVISALNSQIPAGFAMVVPVKFLQDEVK